MARGNVRKTSQVKTIQQVSDAIAAPPGLAPPPGLPAPSARARREATRRLAELDPLSLQKPPGLESISEDASLPDSTTAGESSDESPSLASPMYIKSSFGASEPSAEATSAGTFQVQLIGLPNMLLGAEMFEAILQQANLKGEYESYTTMPGKIAGEATINLYNACAAEWCVQHFHGCSWVADIMIQAHFLNRPEQDFAFDPWLEVCDLDFVDCQSASHFGLQPPAAFHPPHFQQGDDDEPLAEGNGSDAVHSAEVERQSFSLSVDAPSFIPACAMSGGLSAEAPEFVPGSKSEDSIAPDMKFVNTSDVSTVDGDSEADSESLKEGGAIEVAA